MKGGSLRGRAACGVCSRAVTRGADASRAEGFGFTGSFPPGQVFGFARVRAKMAWKRVLASLAFVSPLQAEALAAHSSTSPQTFLKNAARPSSADRASEYERKTQAPIVWLNLKKTELPAAAAAVSTLDYEANLVAEKQSPA